MINWRSLRWHMSMYHGYRQMWMFGVSEEELMRIHGACYKWCHKPERDAGVLQSRKSGVGWVKKTKVLLKRSQQETG